MLLDDTIAAIATPLGEGGLAVIRLSGREALSIADKSFQPVGKSSINPSAAPTHTIHYGRIIRHGQSVDEVLLAVMRAPRTLTREDVVEITCHGGLLPAKLVLDTVLENGARLAEPGEFTKRAFLNGRIDLAQAEAVADLIHARTELALTAANEQLAGKLSQRINALRDDMVKTLAHVEAHIDFPDEDISPDTKVKLIGRLERGLEFMEELLRTSNEGQILRRGIRAAIIGRPNAGKSSLLNQLLGRDRAIVSHIPGTTRDTIEETANVRGLPIVFVDTAGLREAGDEIEVEGIRRSRETLSKAEFILHVLDASEPLTMADENYLAEFSDKKRILVRNKMDLPAKLDLQTGIHAPVVEVCCLSGKGIETLKDAIKSMVWAGEIRAEMLQVMINSRHQEALNRARSATQRTITALKGDETLELVAMDLRIAVNAVGEIVGKTTTEDILDSIFSQFCIGK
ncbi:tRNA uridine-5-carboxymethylaminomethyl(34) synthesis GTPase MnmE [Pedosphaera parvula]|uniref:tRNA modification GTPase MnmE n=1 Tax=Pedosphaera parvula (strain Ellin514) TaxID=320771 RepID=B9XIZ6_PEDPL|nr:tRNA uridine-5-carboxymethylaminomethyl(34) synthesis GTPase MnmE [Pedosphaera parvula]EEF60223.1 tRNA modification GTPase TrmE [Pedosphaera parvula Ellin514]